MDKLIDKTLTEIMDRIEDTVFSEKYSRIDGFFQRLNPEIKIISFLILIIATIFSRGYAICMFFTVSLIFVKISKVPLKFYLLRVILFVPLFTAIVALPSIINIFQHYEGTPLLVIHDFHHRIDLLLLKPFSEITITLEGVIFFFTLLTRVTTAVSFGILLMMTTRWSEFMNSLLRLKLPKIFVLIIGMTYRYIFLLIHMLENMMLSRKSRTTGKKGTVKSWKLNASIIGALFIKSYDMSREIYLAMVSRGFNGTYHAMELNSEKNRFDYLFLILAVLISIFCLIMERI